MWWCELKIKCSPGKCPKIIWNQSQFQTLHKWQHVHTQNNPLFLQRTWILRLNSPFTLLYSKILCSGFSRKGLHGEDWEPRGGGAVSLPPWLPVLPHQLRVLWEDPHLRGWIWSGGGDPRWDPHTQTQHTCSNGKYTNVISGNQCSRMLTPNQPRRWF